MSCFWDKSNIISWFFNVINILFTFFVYFKYGKKIKEQQIELNQQQKKLNDLYLKKEEREEKEEKSAVITLKYDKGKRILIVKNIGKAKARNVNIRSKLSNNLDSMNPMLKNDPAFMMSMSKKDPAFISLYNYFPREYINPQEEINLEVIFLRDDDKTSDNINNHRVEYIYKWNDDLEEHEDTQIIQYM